MAPGKEALKIMILRSVTNQLNGTAGCVTVRNNNTKEHWANRNQDGLGRLVR